MNTIAAKAPWHLWVIGVLTLLWNAIGVGSFMMSILGKLDALGMTAEQIAYFNSFPAWANAVWALGVLGAFLGSVFLLLRSRHAVTALAISIIGLIGTTVFQHFVVDVPADLQTPGIDAAIWIITIGTLLYSWRMRQRGVLR